MELVLGGRARLLAGFVSLLVLLGFSASGFAQGTAAPALGWTFLPADGAVAGMALSDDGSDLVAVLAYGFDPGGAIVSLDPATGAERWRAEIAESPSASPVIADGIVYAGVGSLISGKSAAYALDAATGSQIWRTDITNNELPATPVDGVAVGAGTVYITRGDGVVLAVDSASGRVRWEARLAKPPRGAPVVEGDAVFVSTGFDGASIVALDAARGDVRWSVDRPENPVTRPAVADGVLYVGFESGEVGAFDAVTGAERWTVAAGRFDEGAISPPYPGLPLIANGQILVTSNGFSGAATEALDLQTGARIWIADVGDFSGSAPAVDGAIVLVGSDTGELLGLDMATGEERWRVQVPERIHLDLDQDEPPLVAGKWIFVDDKAGGVVGLAG